MKLYTLTKRKFALVFIVFLTCFSLSVIVGLAGNLSVIKLSNRGFATRIYPVSWYKLCSMVTVYVQCNATNQWDCIYGEIKSNCFAINLLYNKKAMPK